MSRFKEYFLKSFLLVGGIYTILMVFVINLLRLLSYNSGYRSEYTVIYVGSIFLFLFLACYANFRLAINEVNKKTLRRKNQVMFNMPMLIITIFLISENNFFNHASELGFLLAGNLMFYLINLLFTFLILRFLKRKSLKNIEDIVDYEG
jgi:hypothetical protein